MNDELTITIDGEMLEVDNVQHGGYLPVVEIGNLEYYVAEDSENAGKAAREYWEDLANNDPEEFTCIVGKETLVQWALGQSAGPGYVHVSSLEDWLDLTADYPEEQWAGYDGTELEVDSCSESLAEELGFTPTVAYRWN